MNAARAALGGNTVVLCDSRYQLESFAGLDGATPNQEEVEALTASRIDRDDRVLVESGRALLARLRDAIRRPERVIYRPAEAARRLKVGRTKLYDLWNSGHLAYHRDRAGRYSTEAQVQAYLRDCAAWASGSVKPGF